MMPATFHRLHDLRQANDAHRYFMEEHAPRFDAYRTRREDGTAPAAVSAFQLFQTPAHIARLLVDALHLQPGARVLEPSAGLGRILDALPQDAEAVAVEIAPALVQQLHRQDKGGRRIVAADFLTTTPTELGTFDAVAMNPPFHMRADVRHIMHAMTFLRPGGRLAALCMDTHHRADALRPMADTWQTLPARSFRAEGTNIDAILLTITKRTA